MWQSRLSHGGVTEESVILLSMLYPIPIHLHHLRLSAIWAFCYNVLCFRSLLPKAALVKQFGAQSPLCDSSFVLPFRFL